MPLQMEPEFKQWFQENISTTTYFKSFFPLANYESFTLFGNQLFGYIKTSFLLATNINENLFDAFVLENYLKSSMELLKERSHRGESSYVRPEVEGSC